MSFAQALGFWVLQEFPNRSSGTDHLNVKLSAGYKSTTHKSFIMLVLFLEKL